MSAVVRRLASCMPSDAASTRRASCGTLDITASFAKSEAKSRERCASIGAQDLQKEQPTEEYLNHRRPSLDPLCLTPRTQASFVDSLRSPFLHLLKQSSFYESNAPHISSAHSPINATHTPLNSTHTTINSAHTPRNSTHSSLNTPHTPTSYAHSLTAPDENGTGACKQRPPATACNGLLQDASSRHYLMRRRHTLQQADLGASPEVPNPRKSSAPSLMSFPALSPCLEGKSKGANFFPLGRSDGDRGEEEPDQKEKRGWEGKEEKKEREEEEEEKRRVRKIPRIFVSDGNDERRRRILAREVLEPKDALFSSGSCGTHPREVKDHMPLSPASPYALFSGTGIFRGRKDSLGGGYTCSSTHGHPPSTSTPPPTPTPTVGAILGRGGFGTVKVGCYRGIRVAVKVLKGRRAAASATQEANLLPLPPHAHVTSTYAVVTPTERSGLASVTWAPDQVDGSGRVEVLPAGDVACMFSLPDEDLTPPAFSEYDEDAHEGGGAWAWVVSELCTPRTLLSLINDTGIALVAREKVRYIQELASGLTYLHAQGIVHRDVKPANALLDTGGRLRLADFGCSSGPGRDEVAVIGTVPYQAPEVLRGGMGCSRSDIFSLGVTAWHLITRRAPFEGLHHHVVLYQVTCLHHRPPHHIPLSPSPSLLEVLLARLASRCWAEEPKERPDALTLVSILGALSCSSAI